MSLLITRHIGVTKAAPKPSISCAKPPQFGARFPMTLVGPLHADAISRITT
jgi:hypothetical protein